MDHASPKDEYNRTMNAFSGSYLSRFNAIHLVVEGASTVNARYTIHIIEGHASDVDLWQTEPLKTSDLQYRCSMSRALGPFRLNATRQHVIPLDVSMNSPAELKHCGVIIRMVGIGDVAQYMFNAHLRFLVNRPSLF